MRWFLLKLMKQMWSFGFVCKSQIVLFFNTWYAINIAAELDIFQCIVL